ncbi:Uncharacterized protein TCM_012125 [Theobroma cacao]|uniref:Uncharacterized protein n=1 Tax=Theobroma cacao TaxID=3641 RepID=A0A061FUA0_THECC|nr:Uncharacterized protein TCM_012125 [Theobroma cacao]
MSDGCSYTKVDHPKEKEGYKLCFHQVSGGMRNANHNKMEESEKDQWDFKVVVISESSRRNINEEGIEGKKISKKVSKQANGVKLGISNWKSAREQEPDQAKAHKRHGKTITIKTTVPEEEMALVKCSAVGRSRTKISCNVIQSGLFAEGRLAQIKALESMAVLVTFVDKDDMEVLLEKYLELFKVIAVDKSTYKRERFDQAFMLVEANSILEIPTRVSIEVEGIVSNVCVSIVGVEDMCSLEQYLKDKKEMKVGGKKT